jgi:predicted protein tyrosine phosphatase
MKYLFLCHGGSCRGPTAAGVAERMARDRGLDITMFYGGIDSIAEKGSSLRLSIQESDRIFAMQPDIRTTLLDKYHQNPEKVLALDIPDEYNLDDPELVERLERELSPLI